MVYAYEFVFITNYDAARYALYPDGTPALQSTVQAIIANMRAVMRSQPGISVMASDAKSGNLTFKVTLCRNQITYDRFFA